MSALVRLACLVFAVSALLAVAQAKSSQPEVRNQLKGSPFTACIDDKDCRNLGSDYACFQYICYPWSNQSKVPPQHRKKTCRSKDECENGQTCFRHHDRRNIHQGLCMNDVVDCSDGGHADCKRGPNRRCCNGIYCCEERYFQQLKKLSCVTDAGCQDFGYGQFCCPNKAANMSDPHSPKKVCCDTDPNPPAKPAPRPKTAAASSTLHLSASTTIFLSIGLYLTAVRQ